jgi:hypothetical protein
MSEHQNPRDSLYQIWWKQLQNRPSIAAISLAGALVIALASFTDALTKIVGLFRSTPPPVLEAEISTQQAQAKPNPAPMLGSKGSLPINYAVEVVVHNKGTGPATHCGAEINTNLATYSSISPKDLTIPPKSSQPVTFGFEEAGLRDIHNALLLVRCDNTSADPVDIK